MSSQESNLQVTLEGVGQDNYQYYCLVMGKAVDIEIGLCARIDEISKVKALIDEKTKKYSFIADCEKCHQESSVFLLARKNPRGCRRRSQWVLHNEWMYTCLRCGANICSTCFLSEVSENAQLESILSREKLSLSAVSVPSSVKANLSPSLPTLPLSPPAGGTAALTSSFLDQTNCLDNFEELFLKTFSQLMNFLPTSSFHSRDSSCSPSSPSPPSLPDHLYSSHSPTLSQSPASKLGSRYSSPSRDTVATGSAHRPSNSRGGSSANTTSPSPSLSSPAGTSFLGMFSGFTTSVSSPSIAQAPQLNNSFIQADACRRVSQPSFVPLSSDQGFADLSEPIQGWVTGADKLSPTDPASSWSPFPLGSLLSFTDALNLKSVLSTDDPEMHSKLPNAEHRDKREPRQRQGHGHGLAQESRSSESQCFPSPVTLLSLPQVSPSQSTSHSSRSSSPSMSRSLNLSISPTSQNRSENTIRPAERGRREDERGRERGREAEEEHNDPYATAIISLVNTLRVTGLRSIKQAIVRNAVAR